MRMKKLSALNVITSLLQVVQAALVKMVVAEVLVVI
jgi:hypothetical protein